MYSAKLMDHPFGRLIAAVVVGLLTTADSAWCDCSQKYPDSDVTVELNKFTAQDCALETMLQGYTNFLQEQHQLIKLLKPAYSRKLKKMADNAAISNDTRELRLNEFDTNLSDLLTQKKALEAWISESKPDTDSETAQERMIQMKSNLKLLLINATTACQASNKKVKQSKAVITDSESNTFCKLDFVFRVSQKLNKMIEMCLSVN